MKRIELVQGVCPSFSSFRLRRSASRGARLACEADLEHKAKATADRLSSISRGRSNGVLQCWSSEIQRCPQFLRVKLGTFGENCYE
jgi:hypothetical protein